MKKLLLPALLAAALLCGCAKNQSGEALSQSSGILSQSQEISNEVYYKCDSLDSQNANSFKWLNEGEILALPYKNTIQYIGLDNKMKSAVQLPEDAGVNYVLNNGFIFVVGTKKTENSENKMQIRFENGEYIFANCSLYDNMGKQVKDFPVFEALQEETPVQWPQIALNAFWINDDTLIVQVKNTYIFSYSVSQDKVSLIEDQSPLIDNVIKEKGQQYELLSAVSRGEDTEFIYSAFENGKLEYYLYNGFDETETRLDISPLQGRYSAFSQNGESYVKVNLSDKGSLEACVDSVK